MMMMMTKKKIFFVVVVVVFFLGFDHGDFASPVLARSLYDISHMDVLYVPIYY